MTHLAALHPPPWDFLIPAICLGILAGSVVFTSTPRRPKAPDPGPDPAPEPPSDSAEPPL